MFSLGNVNVLTMRTLLILLMKPNSTTNSSICYFLSLNRWIYLYGFMSVLCLLLYFVIDYSYPVTFYNILKLSC